MKEGISLKIIKIVAIIQVLAGISCLVGGISYSMLTHSRLDRLTIYIWISCLISFLLAYGLYNLREWSRKSLLLFIVFGWVNQFLHLSPNLSSFVTPHLPNPILAETIKVTLLGIIDAFLIFFFTRPNIKKLFK